MEIIDENDKTEEADKAEASTWLKHLSLNSWEPEIIISGIFLAFILAFPAQLYNFSAILIQDFGIDYLGAWLTLIYLSFVINVFKIFFILHLLLRFAWVAMLGVNSAFPKGVINEKLFGYTKDYAYQKPQHFAMKLDRLCSMSLGIPLTFLLIILPISLFLLLLLFVYKVFNLNFFLVYIIFLLCMFLAMIFMMGKKRTRLKNRYSTSLMSTISAIYTSNIGKWNSIVFQVFIFLLATPFIVSDTKDFAMFNHFKNVDKETFAWPKKGWYFGDQMSPEKRFPRIMLPAEQISDSFTLINLAYYPEDEENLNYFKKEKVADSLQWGSVNKITDLYRFYIDDSVRQITEWRPVTQAASGQKVYEGLLNLSGLSTGMHQLRVEKMTQAAIMGIKRVSKYRDHWAVLYFNYAPE